MKNPHAAEWEELARRKGYFAVLTHEGDREVEESEVATSEFFATGEADLSSLLSVAESMVGHGIPLTSALDFGCGAGRLTLPLARRAETVTASDIAPTMLAHARRNAEESGLRNIAYVESDRLEALPGESFSFICSLLVLQYVPRSIGFEIIRTLLRLLAPGGIVFLHVMLAPPGEGLRRLVRLSRARSRFDRPSSRVVRDGSDADGMQTYPYDEREVIREIEAAGARVVGRVAAPVGDTPGAVFIIEKPST
ncbi:MAG TPA: class I SAM-dependent methyltransferase [Thermoanaerobaculia bacterium]|nr:class I SAM-dependent methyltransferase [Thermoanaerobaculia bacterium]